MIPAFPKIFSIGTCYIENIFEDDVEITEKIDGSQLAFGKVDGNLIVRSKGRIIDQNNVDNLFQEAVDYVVSIQDKIPDNTFYYCEYLQRPKHNILAYERIPKNHLILFGACGTDLKFVNYENLKYIAQEFEIELVPLIFYGKVNNAEELLKLLENDSILGGQKIEGIVVKNYNRPFLLGGQPIALMSGKFVSEKFKETHREKWGQEFTAKGRWKTFCDSFRTEARWEKAVQHLKENGELEHSPRDIGKLMIEVKKDIGQEEKDNIMKFLWKEYGKEAINGSVHGMAEWYKSKLLKDSLDKE